MSFRLGLCSSSRYKASVTASQQLPGVQRCCRRAQCYPWQEERIVGMETQAGPRRADAGTVCRQCDVDQTRVAIAEWVYRRSLEGWCSRRGERVVAVVCWSPLPRCGECLKAQGREEEAGTTGQGLRKPCSWVRRSSARNSVSVVLC